MYIETNELRKTFTISVSLPEPGSVEEKNIFTGIQQQFHQQYEKIFPDKLAPRTVVIIPSLSLDAEILSKVKGFIHYEERMLCLLMLLRMPLTKIIYVTSIPIPDVIVDYYLHLLPGITGRHARKRMTMRNELSLDRIFVQTINDEQLQQANIELDVLRLDEIHSIISGNKWFKLKYYLQEFSEKKHTCLATFGGAFSNHLLATAYACAIQKIKCIGFIRGEEPEHYSQTLSDAKALNMQLIFLSRKEYSDKQKIIAQHPSIFFIPEGGYGKNGAEGAAEILEFAPNFSKYNYIVCAVGTGTMLAGICNSSESHQKVIGISGMKNNFSLKNDVSLLISENKDQPKILHDYHFGGYAKYTTQLIDFMNETWKKHFLPLDFVYTAKGFYAVFDLFKNNFFSADAKILFIHSGGLQGNRSLKKDALLF